MVPLAHAAVLKNYLDVSQQLDVNAHHLLSSVGLNLTQLNDTKQRIPVDKAIDLLEQSAQISGCEVFGLRMAEQRQLSDFGEISLLLSYQHTLRDALQTIVRYRNLLNNALAIYIEEVGNTVIIREEVVTTASVYSRQSTELALGITHRLCAALLSQKWKPLSIHFTHSAPSDLAAHKRFFGCSLEFGSEFNGIVCTATDLDTTNPQANTAMADHAQRYLDILQNDSESSIIFDIRKSIYLLLPMGRATIDQIAHTHGINVRTLQRRLEASQTSFSDLMNDVRRNLVFRYLNNLNYSLGQVSDILGYSTPSSFTRWFISQFKMAPTTWRNSNKALLD
ncbi:AraC family transcriptional regulator [Acinetobacter sp. ANC 3832]|uniref:AraC family transcriptional regulator n=1 Tax=Acinetobacter sp. ANC 3832 TaxID=1977874 RepID=UPI000A342081|nr:AraC family transcriptional regulator [Acinetobacter sp. ANC 3832]OTG91186.1 AraC family transcriptional regulator [Acinetobacter sp. ANC 3832]